MKPFSSIPGPRSWPLIGNLHEYTVSKKYDFQRLYKNGLSKYREFGPVVKEEIVSGLPIVWIFDPQDVKAMFMAEGKFPSRRSHLALEHYRKSKPEVYNNGGLLPTNGCEWSRLRLAAQKPLTMALLEGHKKAINEASLDFCSKIRHQRSVDNILEELKGFFLEVTGLVVLGTSLKAMQGHNEAETLIKAAMDTNAHVLKTDNDLRLWRFFETADYKKIKASQGQIEEIALKYVRDSRKFSSNSLINCYKDQNCLDSKDIVTIIGDFLFAGIDTSANSMAFLLHELAKNELVQESLGREVQNVDFDSLKAFKLGKAIIKESLRLHPISVGIGRNLAFDAAFSGYFIPKGTLVVTQNQISCRLPEFCPVKPDSFWPFRYLNNEGHNDERLHPFLALPFGFGPRMCIGRRLAEMSMQILLLQVAKAFFIHTDNDGDLGCINYLINQPEYPVKLTFQPKK
uniref:Cytochrome P450 302A1 n=1 Tax=Paracyclopina nana TaxID=565004 RepID=A0A0F7IZY6_PARNA|nr:cytochrome P450 302A1 [Paracyclopina nana]